MARAREDPPSSRRTKNTNKHKRKKNPRNRIKKKTKEGKKRRNNNSERTLIHTGKRTPNLNPRKAVRHPHRALWALLCEARFYLRYIYYPPKRRCAPRGPQTPLQSTELIEGGKISIYPRRPQPFPRWTEVIINIAKQRRAGA